MRTVAAGASALIFLSGCGTTSMPSLGMPSLGMPGGGSRQAALPIESFSYSPAGDRNFQVEVLTVVSAEDSDYIPSDPNWLQIRVRLTNTGARTANLSSVKARLADGSTLNSASSASEVIKPPSLVREGLTHTGLGLGTMAAGALLFPPAAILGGAYMAFRPMLAGDRVGRIADRISREGLRVGPIAPGTNTNGYVFLPAVTGQTALIVFYDVAGSQESLVIPRTPN